MDTRILFIIFCCFTLVIDAIPQSSTPPVRILKQINRQNEDGSYSFGYENEDGSYKIESKTANGEVSGKYGYVDEAGKLREIEYGASKRGFEPAGPGITVPPPVLHVQNTNAVESDYDDGQYREDPSIYDRTETPHSRLPATRVAPAFRHNPNFRYESAPSASSAQPQANHYSFYSRPAAAAAPAAPPHNAASYNDAGYYHGYPNYDYTVNFQG